MLSRAGRERHIAARPVQTRPYGALAAVFVALVMLASIGLARPTEAHALRYACYFGPPEQIGSYNLCDFAGLNSGANSAWSGARFFWQTEVISNINTQYLKGIRWYRGGSYYGWWYGGNGQTVFDVLTAPPHYPQYQQSMCKNGGGARQVMLCSNIFD